MHEGHVDKASARRRNGLVKPAFDSRLDDAERQVVGGEGAVGAAEHVAGKLVEDDDQGQAPVGRLPPIGQTTRRRALVFGGEAFADGRVEGVVLLEPQAFGTQTKNRECG